MPNTPQPDFPQPETKLPRKVRLTARQWKQIDEDAQSRGTTSAEAFRRIVDEHFLRQEIEERTLYRVRSLERRLVDVEKRLAEAG